MPESGSRSEMADGAPRDFRTTHWSVVLEAGGATDDARTALEKLCRTYWYPLYGFVRQRGYDEHGAKDLTQQFFARLLSDDSLQSVSPEKGRFRTFLLAAMKHFLANEWRDSQRLKRGGGKQIVSWDALEAEERLGHEPVDDTSPDLGFDRRWAETVVNEALDRLSAEMARDGLRERFEVLGVFLKGHAGETSYAAAAARAGLSEAATKGAIFRMRRRYGELIREIVAETVGTQTEVKAEIQYLIAIHRG